MLLFKMAKRKGGLWGGKYDRLEHFKRFNIDVIKELSKISWIIIYKKDKFTGISLNPKYKKEIIEFVEIQLPYLKGVLK
mgnify:FL=1